MEVRSRDAWRQRRDGNRLADESAAGDGVEHRRCDAAKPVGMALMCLSFASDLTTGNRPGEAEAVEDGDVAIEAGRASPNKMEHSP